MRFESGSAGVDRHSIIGRLQQGFSDDSQSVNARSSRRHVYAARNLIESIPEVSPVWREEPLVSFWHAELGEGFGLVRALFFDKPPDRTWNLPRVQPVWLVASPALPE